MASPKIEIVLKADPSASQSGYVQGVSPNPAGQKANPSGTQPSSSHIPNPSHSNTPSGTQGYASNSPPTPPPTNTGKNPSGASGGQGGSGGGGVSNPSSLMGGLPPEEAGSMGLSAVAAESVGLTLAFGALVEIVSSLYQEFSQLSDSISEINPEAASAHADRTIRELETRLQQAQDLSPEAVAMQKAMGDLNVAATKIETDIAQVLMPLISVIVEALAGTLEMLDTIIHLGQKRDLKEIEGSFRNQIENFLARRPVAPGNAQKPDDRPNILKPFGVGAAAGAGAAEAVGAALRNIF